ncbi:MAG: DUF2330 domain-containing protein [Bacteroidia bacterium]
MKKTILTFTLIASVIGQLQAFCGFYVAKAGAELFNNKSEVIIVRDGHRSIVTMSSDFNGNVKDFAMVIPVPNVLQREDIRIVERSLFQKLDAYSSPRLAEYYDNNPCNPPIPKYYLRSTMVADEVMESSVDMLEEDADLGVTIEAQYDVDEYQIMILSAKESGGLKIWLIANGYDIPEKADDVLDPYIKSGLKFFVVKVNLNKYDPASNGGYLRPIQISMETEKFMLPIRLGMANSVGDQDMIVYALTKKGRIETTNYRTVKIPTNKNVPTFIKQKFSKFYKSVFDRSHKMQGENAVFLEYAWNVSPSWAGVKCDPCVGNPPYMDELTQAGVDWLNQGEGVFFTRLHVRYGLSKFPQDLFFQVTPNKEHFQARYVVHNPATGDLQCTEGFKYMKKLRQRRSKELMEMEALSGWDATDHTAYIYIGMDVKTNDDEGKAIPVISGDLPKNPKPLLMMSTMLFMVFAVLRIRKIYNLSNI